MNHESHRSAQGASLIATPCRCRALPGLAGLLALALASIGCGGGSGAAEARYRHVLFVSMDTTRADHIGAYGQRAVKTPAIDALAAEGIHFTDCTSAAATTLASHTSLFTGTYPLRHGATRNGFQVSDENLLLSDVLRRAGFYCAAFLGSSALTSAAGLDSGFDHYDDGFRLKAEAGGRDQDQRPAREVTSALLTHVDEVLDAHADDARLFLFAHYFDPHAPYAPGPEMVQRYGAGRDVGDFDDIEDAVRRQQQRALGGSSLEAMPGQQGVITGGMTRELLQGASGVKTPAGADLAKLYAGEITRTDAAIGSLLAGLEARGVLEDTLVVLTADHGETFWEHGNFWNHGLWVSQSDVNVPLIVRFPDGRGAGTRSSVPVSGVDVMPTILDALALEGFGVADVLEDGPSSGRSLLPLVDGAGLSARPVFSEATQPGGSQESAGLRWRNARKPQAVRLGSYKLIDAPYLGLTQLFDLAADPGEKVDLLAQGAPLSGAASDAEASLRAALAAWRESAAPLPSEFDPSQVKTLQGMGYFDAK